MNRSAAASAEARAKVTAYLAKLIEGGEKDTHRLTVCGLTYLRELDGSSRSGQGRLYRAVRSDRADSLAAGCMSLANDFVWPNLGLKPSRAEESPCSPSIISTTPLAADPLAAGRTRRALRDDALPAQCRPRRLAPPELTAVHPLGKSPVITDGDVRIAESGAIVDYLIRTYGKGAMMPAPGSADYEAYNEWLHYAEGSAMLPLMLNLYVVRLKEAGAPLHPRIDSEIANHLGYIDGALKGREFFVGNSLTGADIQMSFVGEMAKVFDKLAPYPNLAAWLSRMHARPAFQRSVEKGGAYRFA